MFLEVCKFACMPFKVHQYTYHEDWKRVSPSQVQRLHPLLLDIAKQGAVLAPAKFQEGCKLFFGKSKVHIAGSEPEIWVSKFTTHIQAILRLLRQLKVEEEEGPSGSKFPWHL